MSVPLRSSFSLPDTPMMPCFTKFPLVCDSNGSVAVWVRSKCTVEDDIVTLSYARHNNIITGDYSDSVTPYPWRSQEDNCECVCGDFSHSWSISACSAQI